METTQIKSPDTVDKHGNQLEGNPGMVYTGSNPAEGFSSSALHHTLLSLANYSGTTCVLLESENISHC